jgi:hypothetical protein
MELQFNGNYSDNDDSSTIASEILNIVENYESSLIDGQTSKTIMNDIIQCLQEHEISNIEKISNQLKNYIFVDEIHNIHKGRHIRWIRLSNEKKTLTLGGLIMDVKFTNNGVNILCKDMRNRFIQFKFDECLTFQRLSYQELVILMANESINYDSS